MGEGSGRLVGEDDRVSDGLWRSRFLGDSSQGLDSGIVGSLNERKGYP